MAPPWTPPAEERAIGLGYYATAARPIGGLLKDRPEDFRVRELSRFPMPAEDGLYTVLRVVSRNWEQHELSQRLAQRLGLPPSAIAWAGTKDRRAVADRLASYRGRPPDVALGLPGVDLIEAYRAREGLVLGHHYGNAFEIRVGAVEVPAETVRAAVAELTAVGGVPNFFGPQRFGEVRPITHEVGRAIVHGDVVGAVEIYLTAIAGPAGHRGDAARRAYAADHDAAAALRAFPAEFRFERQLLDHLARGHDAARALRALSRELRTLFVHAYQALLFNRYLTARAAAGLSVGEPVPGDHVLRVARDGTVPGTAPVPVAPDNLEEVAHAVARGRAVVAAPLVGFETPPVEGRPGELWEALLGEEQVRRSDFEIRAAPDLASRGSFRPLRLGVPPLAVAPDPESGPGSAAAWWVRFALPKGSYATVLLRELQKTGATPVAADPKTEPGGSNRAY